jgi:hypothetical protein
MFTQKTDRLDFKTFQPLEEVTAMSASIVERTANSITVQIQIPLSPSSLLDSEEWIQSALNEAGSLATGEAIQKFDTNGEKLERGGSKWTSKGKLPKTYQTPYGSVKVFRHVYQRSYGGETYCPLEIDGRIILTSTPKFAQQLSHKYAEMSSPKLVEDLQHNHGRTVTRSFIQNVAEAVGSIAQLKEEEWSYQTPKLPQPVATVSIGIDGTCLLLCEGGFRQAMVGTISLYDALGERHHTIYVAARPEYGKSQFLARMSQEIAQVKTLYPTAHFQAHADGAAENWAFLTPLTDSQVLDFYHATQYLDRVAKAIHPRSVDAQQGWMTENCHKLKHEKGAAVALLTEMQTIQNSRLSKAHRDGLNDAITYFQNHHPQMNYADVVQDKRPIGSGVTEAGCKVIIKARLCAAGMKWKELGASIVLSLRTLSYSTGRWQQFWAKINRYGFNLSEL